MKYLHRNVGAPFIRTTCLLLAFLVCGVHAQDQSNPVILENADVFSGKRYPNGEDVRELEGNVRFRQSGVRVWCDRAIQFLNRNEIELSGNVKVVRDTVTLTSKKGRYYGNTRVAICEGSVKLRSKSITITADVGNYYTEEKRAFFQKNVKVVDSTSIIYSDRLTYYEKERKSEAVSNVRIQNPADNITMYGEYLEHYDSTGYSRMSDRPRLMQIDTSAAGEIDTLAVQSRIMESFDDSTKRLIATDSVAIVRGPLAARCALLRFYRNEEKIDLYSKPVVWYDDNQVSGDTILLFLQKNRLKSVQIKSRAFVLSQSDSAFPQRYNQLSGRNITLAFEKNKLQETKVERNATSLYFLYEDGRGNGVNRTSGDFITMKFDDGKPNTIWITKGIEGQYYPENLYLRNPAAYNLDGFILQPSRPVIKTIFPQRTN